MTETTTPVPVRIVADETLVEQEKAAAYGNWQTFAFVGTENLPQQLIPQADKRKRAVLNWNVAATGVLFVGNYAEVQNALRGGAGSGSFGGLKGSGTIVLEDTQALWAQPDGTNAAYVVILDERYQ